MFNKNKRAIKGILNNIEGVVETLTLIVDALIQNKTRIDKLEKRVLVIENMFAEDIVTCSKCSCLTGKQFVFEDKEGYYFCEGCKLKDIKKSKKK